MSEIEDVHQSARNLLPVVDRVRDVVQQVADGKWDGDLTPDQAARLATTLEVTAERLRYTRAQIPDLAGQDEDANARAAITHMAKEWLPLNRKERFFTGTVLPMVVASDGLATLGLFLRLCGLDVQTDTPGSLSGDLGIQFFTEYNLMESVKTTADHARWPDLPVGGDTPDIVIAGPDWLVAVEAKMYDRPSTADLRGQLERQGALLDYISGILHIERSRTRHVALLPRGLSVGELPVPVVTWEQVADAYQGIAPVYWHALLRVSLLRYEELVTEDIGFGKNADAHLTGAEIVQRHADGTLEFTYVGRWLGSSGKHFQADLVDDRWRERIYEVRRETRIYEVRRETIVSHNWFPISEFIRLTAAL